MIDYQLIRSSRRTLSISVNGEGALVVRAPKRMPVRQIEAFVEEKREWIAQKQELRQEQAAQRQQAQLAEGAQIPFWGECLTLHFEAVKTARDDGWVLVLPMGQDALKQALKWRRRRAEELLAPRVAYWVERTGLQPEKVSYGHASTRWGSMSGRGSLRLNTALIHLTPEMADYVIVHELAHIRQPNHSPAFHALVRSILPEADRIRAQMKAYSYVTTLWKEL